MSGHSTPQDARAALRAARGRMRRWLVDYYGEAPAAPTEADRAALAAELGALEAKLPGEGSWESPHLRVLPPSQDPFPTRRHQVPMLSLSNAYTVDELREWEASLLRLLPDTGPEYLTQLKIDGLAISLIYEEGRLAAAVTRGDGEVGEDVTPNIKTIAGLPHVLPDHQGRPLTLEVRGEVYFTLADFAQANRQRERMGEPLFKNPRNAAVGTLRMLDTAQVGRRRLRVAIHALAALDGGDPAFDSDWDTLEWLKALGLPVTYPVRRFASIEDIEPYYTEVMDQREQLGLPD